MAQTENERNHARYGCYHVACGRVLSGRRTALLDDPAMDRPAKGIEPVRHVIEGARAYASQRGLGDPHDGGVDYHSVRTHRDLLKDLARSYDALPEDDPSAHKHFAAMRGEVNDQYHHLTHRMGIKVHVTDEDPYPDVHALRHDVLHNKQIQVLGTHATGGHPFFTNDENDKFRAVHDVFGHLGTGRDFDRHGEEATYQAHARMFTPLARGALASETRGQSGSLILSGQFGPQRIAVMPKRLWHPGLAHAAATENPLEFHHSETESGGSKWPVQHVLRAGTDDALMGRLDYFTSPRRKKVLVQNLEVYPEHQRKGVGSALMDELQRRHPDASIDHGDRTDAGKQWWSGYTEGKPVRRGRTATWVAPEDRPAQHTAAYFHGSDRHIPVGQYVEPGHQGTYDVSRPDRVYLTDNHADAAKWASDALEMRPSDHPYAYVHEVEPEGPVTRHEHEDGTEYHAPRAKVVRVTRVKSQWHEAVRHTAAYLDDEGPYFHASWQHFEPGQRLTPPKRRGITYDHPAGEGWRNDRVWLSRTPHHAHGWLLDADPDREAHVYEVKPIGVKEHQPTDYDEATDADPQGQYQARGAEVVRKLHPSEYQSHQAARHTAASGFEYEDHEDPHFPGEVEHQIHYRHPDGNRAGTLTYARNEEEPGWPTIDMRYVHVEPEYRGQGIATKLLNHLGRFESDVDTEDFHTHHFEHPAAAKAWATAFGSDHPALEGTEFHHEAARHKTAASGLEDGSKFAERLDKGPDEEPYLSGRAHEYSTEHVAPGGQQYRLMHDYGGFSKSHVTAHQRLSNGKYRGVGYLSWFPGKPKHNGSSIDGGVIHKVQVSPQHQRRGLASAMLAFARERNPDLDIRHSNALTDEGRAWAEKVGMQYVAVEDRVWYHGTSAEDAQNIVDQGARTGTNVVTRQMSANDYARTRGKFHSPTGRAVVLEGRLDGDEEEHPWDRNSAGKAHKGIAVTSRPKAFIPTHWHEVPPWERGEEPPTERHPIDHPIIGGHEASRHTAAPHPITQQDWYHGGLLHGQRRFDYGHSHARKIPLE